jgi:two-component system response regulator FlrC
VTDFGLFQTADLQMRKVLETAQSLALTPAPILISGEQGTGKSLLVQLILEKSRSKNVFKWGRDPLSFLDGDVILIERLDELNLLQQQELSEKMDELKMQGRRLRWIATASEKPAALVQNQRLRKDLFYRLSVIHLQIPALRERSTDILILADFFNQVFNLMKSRSHQRLTSEAQGKLLSYGWPGNVAELENVMERAVALTEGNEIPASAIEFSQMQPNLLTAAGTTLSEMERKLILQTLQMTQQNKTRAAQLLGISIRTLRNKLNEYREAGVI